MKVAELMIGDWVHDTRETFNNPVKLTGINAHQINESDPICFLENEEGLGLTGRLSELKPIPLTAEILEKNGFVFKHDVFDGIYPMVSMIYCDYKLLDGRWINGGENEDIRFVHELQNALRLCKVDKEIIL